MFQYVELSVDGRLLRGDVRTPEGSGPFPTVCFYHGFCVDRIGLMRLHELFARKCAEHGIACVKFDFYGCGESDGDFSEMRYLDEVEQAKAIYRWAAEQPWCDSKNLFPVGHSMGGAIVSNIIPELQPKGAVMWAPGNVVYYDISSRVHAVPGQYESSYDIGGLMMSSEFLSQVRRIDIVKQAKGYEREVLLIHGEMDEKVPVYAEGPYLDLYGEKGRFEVIKGANHQFSSVEWKNKVYDLSIAYIKEKISN
ncbi:alpha/beta hydrolase family protein [Lacrimispora sp. 210928-DFI.3.58]|uniref:alpha/beta hydrolase family protein n=1 Tax=Lacrimispora sp. 210928-DFI.3.58 TaxID=2883214 RepID=UPI001D07038D|nr:alpha/beta fold hydrolase [Lacrimispora sp. 210928-DFI.3.58]MCB7319403.1 alpha/beta fold hydrolase [Lacrimispora sp. 210928-DFI.3.58]